VLKGNIKVTHGGEEFDLHEGDSIHVNATIIHRIENVGKENAQVMVSRTPSGFSDIRIDRTEGEA
jgi:quercetin dioxygenase-like cupin family protein